MKCKLLYILCLMLFVSTMSHAQVLSFENASELSDWKCDNGRLAISSERYKFGSYSLKIDWQPGTRVSFESPEKFKSTLTSKHCGITVWFYDEGSQPADLNLIFYGANGKEVCRMPYHLGFKGWRALWAKFCQDMGKKIRLGVTKMVLEFPQTTGTLYVDMLDFPEIVNWKYMEDLHYNTSRTDFRFSPDIVKYRQAVPSQDMIEASDAQIKVIEDKLGNWCLGTGKFSKDKFVRMRTSAEKDFILMGLEVADKYVSNEYNDDGTPVGEPLFTLDGPSRVDGTRLSMFCTINERVLIPLTLDYLKNGNKESLERIKYIYDWFNDQGWADGSSMGTIALEKLRSAGYFYSYHLVRNHLPEDMLARQRAAMNWFTMFGNCYVLNDRSGANADDLRSLAEAKLIYALSIEDPQQKRFALTAFKRYMDKALGIANGTEGMIKDDYSGYHHCTAYNNAYYPNAMYACAKIAWLLSGTPYALSEESVSNIKNALKTYHFFCAGLEIPAGTVGRFHQSQKVLHKFLPSYAYMVLCEKGQDKELLAIFGDILTKVSRDKDWVKYVTDVNSVLSYTTTVGEMEAIAEAASMVGEQTPMKTGSLFMPYSGLLISKDNDIHFNVKGRSRYIWDYESGADHENPCGRWISNGHLEFFDFRNGNRSFNSSSDFFDWNYIPGTTSKVLPIEQLLYNKKTIDHRNYSDQSFLAGVHGAENVSMFSVKLHDIYQDTSFRADKSYFFFKDMVVCLGSGICSQDRSNSVTTTMFQDLSSAGKRKADGIYEDASFAYVVKEGDVRLSKEGKRVVAYIDHGEIPHNAGYEYYLLKDKGIATSVAKNIPVHVLKKDSEAHIIGRDNAVCAALFRENVFFDGMLVESVNIPLAYILEDKGEGIYRLSLCEPDMRRAWKLNMNHLSPNDVAEEEKPFETVLLLDGRFEITGVSSGVSATIENDKTRITLTTVRARNYVIELKEIK